MRPELVEAGRHHAARLWAQRASVEQQAADRFGRLAATLVQTDADATVIELAARAAHDERRHHVRCVELAAMLGDVKVMPPAEPARPVTAGREDPREQLLAEIVAMSCVTESLSAALLVEMRARAEDPRVREVVHEVLRDEVDHARLGWAHLAVESSRTDVRWLAPVLPAMLAATVQEELFDEARAPAPTEAIVAGLGGLPRVDRAAIFVATMEGVVLPGLERFGVDTRAGRAWLAARVGSTQRARPELLREVGEGVGQG